MTRPAMVARFVLCVVAPTAFSGLTALQLLNVPVGLLLFPYERGFRAPLEVEALARPDDAR